MTLVVNFHFAPFIKHMFLKKNRKITKTYYLDLRGHLFQFLRSPESKEFLNDILPICKSLLLSELDLEVDQYDYVKFEGNARKYLQDYCFEVLEEVSHPMTLEQIKDAINRKYPDYELRAFSLRTTLIKHKEKFIYFGRTSTYGLLKWEIEKDNIMGGSIRDIVEKYLKRAHNPKHISEILNYVLKYRPETNISSLRANLNLEKDNRFTFFSGQYVGLKSNSRRDRKFKIKKIVGIHFRSSVFEKMVGWHFDEIVRYFVKEYGYDKVNVTYLKEKDC